MEKELAAQLYILQKSSQDQTAWLLQALSLTKQADPAAILKEYLAIKQGSLKIAQVTTSVALSAEQEKMVRSKVQERFKQEDIVYVFSVNPRVENGIQIRVGDNMLDFSFTSKL